MAKWNNKVQAYVEGIDLGIPANNSTDSRWMRFSGTFGEGGRDAHYGHGKFAVYPRNNFEDHLTPFIKGTFKLKSGTKAPSAIMPYYTISYDIDKVNHENVGNSYSKYLITDLLRNQ